MARKKGKKATKSSDSNHNFPKIPKKSKAETSEQVTLDLESLTLYSSPAKTDSTYPTPSSLAAKAGILREPLGITPSILKTEFSEGKFLSSGHDGQVFVHKHLRTN